VRSILLAASILTLSTLASATPTTPPSPPPAPSNTAGPGCKLTGDLVITETSRPLAAIQKGQPQPATFRTRVFATGGWDRIDTASDGKVTTRSGCLSAADLLKIKTDLDGLTWKQMPNAMACDAVSATVTDVMLKGKVVWTEEMCPSKSLDARSAAMLADIEAVITAAQTPATPPCCKH
jgi:hypothetical protein